MIRRSRRDAVFAVLLLLTILTLGAGLRFYHLGFQSLWSDEGNSAALATRSLVQITRDSANDIHPPLYYWLLHLWSRLFGTSEAGLRSLSALFGVLLVWAAAELARRLHGDATGLAVAFLGSSAPFQVYYSQEARMYALLALETAVALLFFWWYLQSEQAAVRGGNAPKQVWRATLVPAAGMTVMWVAGLYTHYLFPLIIAILSGLYALWIWNTRRDGRALAKAERWLAWCAVAALLFAPWIPIAFRQISTWPTGGNAVPIGQALATSFSMLGLGPIANPATNPWWSWLIPIIAVVGAIPWRQQRGRPCWMSCVLPLSIVVAPIALMLVLGLFKDAYLKFLLVASPAYTIMLARGVLAPAGGLQVRDNDPDSRNGTAPALLSSPALRGFLGAFWVVIALAVLAVNSVGALARYFGDPAAARDDYRGISQFIVATSHQDDAILLVAPGQIEVFNYYYHESLPIYALPQQRPIDVVATTNELSEMFRYDKVYAVYWAEQEADPDGIIQRWMDNHGYKTLDQWRGNVRLAVYVMPETTPPEESAESLALPLGPDIVLQGYRAWNLSPTAGQVTQLQLIWQANKTPENRYKVFLQLLDSRDQVIAQRDSEPAGDSRPTNTWEPGELVVDNHGLLIPPGTPPGTYRRIIGMYDRDTLERLTLPDGSDFIDLPPIQVKRADTAPLLDALNMQHTQRFDFGGIALLGHDRYKRGYGHVPATPLYPGDRLHLTLYWQALVEPRADWWFDLTLNDDSGQVVATLQAPLVSDTYSTTLWQTGEIVRGEHDLQIPDDLPPGEYRLSLVMLPDTNTSAGTAYLGGVRIERPSQTP